MKTLWKLIKKYGKEIILIILGLIVGVALSKKQKEVRLVKDTEKKIKEVAGFSVEERKELEGKLEEIEKVEDDGQRLQGLKALWDFLNT